MMLRPDMRILFLNGGHGMVWDGLIQWLYLLQGCSANEEKKLWVIDGSVWFLVSGSAVAVLVKKLIT